MKRTQYNINCICIGYNTVWSELCECNEQTHSRQCCNLLIAWPVNIGDVFIEVWVLVWLARPICQLCHTLCTLTPDKLSAVSYDPLTQSRHNVGDRSVKAGHKTNRQRKVKSRPQSATTLACLDVPNLQSLVIRTTHDLLIINLPQPYMDTATHVPHRQWHIHSSESEDIQLWQLHGICSRFLTVACLINIIRPHINQYTSSPPTPEERNVIGSGTTVS